MTNSKVRTAHATEVEATHNIAFPVLAAVHVLGCSIPGGLAPPPRRLHGPVQPEIAIASPSHLPRDAMHTWTAPDNAEPFVLAVLRLFGDVSDDD